MSNLQRPIRVWDLPTRLFHWIIVILLGLSWLSVRRDWMELHFLSGYTILTLLLFRLAWGVVGSQTSRFASFLRSPLAAFAHLSRLHRREPDTEIGHNAAGGWMVLLMLVLLAIQVGTGLCANDDIAREGPLASIVGKEWSDWLTRIHGINFTVLQVAVVLHLLAITAYAALKRQDLVRPMITGTKRLPVTMPPPRLASLRLAALLLAGAAVLVYLLVSRT